MAAPVFVIGLFARKAIQFASKKAAEAFIKKNGKGKIVQGLKNIGNRVKTTVRQIRQDNKNLGDNALTKDEAVVGAAILGPGTVASAKLKKMSKKDQADKNKRLGMNRGKK